MGFYKRMQRNDISSLLANKEKEGRTILEIEMIILREIIGAIKEEVEILMIGQGITSKGNNSQEERKTSMTCHRGELQEGFKLNQEEED
jgi:hypothetical protein